MMQSTTYYIQITAGRGPVECAWVVAQVLKRILAEFSASGISCEVINRNQGYEPGTLNSCLLRAKGNLKEVQSWEGTIQWIGKSQYRKFHKRKNWFVGVSTFTETVSMKLLERDLEFSTFRGSGPGGQHRNKVETAVRAVHKPTKLSVTASDSKSQHQNKKMAIEKMKIAFQQFELEKLQQRTDEQWMEHLSLQRGNPVRVYEGRDFKQKRK